MDKNEPFKKWLIKTGYFISGMVMVAFLGFLNYITGSDISLLVLYVFPIYFVVWFCGIRYGVTIAVVSVAVWSVVNYSLPMMVKYDDNLISAWNTSEKVVLFGSIAYFSYRIKRSYDWQKNLAMTDYLTGLYNRRYFMDALRKSFETGMNGFSICYLDIDDYDSFIEERGQIMGDEVIRMLARMIKKIYPGVCKFGDDRFAILLEESKDKTAVSRMAELKKFIGEGMNKKGFPIGLSIAIVYCGKSCTMNGALREIYRLAISAGQESGDDIRFTVID